MRAIELGRDTHNYDVEVMADECTNMLLESGGLGMDENRRSSIDQVHDAGYLTFVEVADLLGIRATDALDLMAARAFESTRIANKPCATAEAVGAYQQVLANRR